MSSALADRPHHQRRCAVTDPTQIREPTVGRASHDRPRTERQLYENLEVSYNVSYTNREKLRITDI